MYAQTQQVIPQEFAVDLIAEIYDQGVGRELNNLPLFRTRKKANLQQKCHFLTEMFLTLVTLERLLLDTF